MADPGITVEDVERSIPACFERIAEIHHSRKAIRSGGWQPTFGELNNAANHLAHALLAHGGMSGDCVAILMRQDRGEILTAVLGALKAGRIVVTLNPSDPPERLRRTLANAEPTILLTDATHHEQALSLSEGLKECLLVENHFATHSSPNPDVPISPNDVAFIMYTSGSTGLPKGVISTHQSMLHHVFRCSKSMEIHEEDRVAAVSSLSGGQGLGMTLCALLNGAAACPFPISAHDMARLATWVVKIKVTVLAAATSVFRQLAKSLPEGQSLPHMRLLRIGSEATTNDDFIAFQRCFSPHCMLMHAFSISETGNISQRRLAWNETVDEGLLPTGRPVEGIEVFLVDEKREVVSHGETGRIVVRSKYLSPGYWQDETLTHQSFASATAADGTRLYYSGDLGRFSADGQLIVLGRKSGHINIGGHTIELAEVEHALLTLPEVSGAVVFTRTTDSGREQIVAAITPQVSCQPDDFKLREGLRQTLPAHMIPTMIAVMDAFPLTSTGKPDLQEIKSRWDEQSVSPAVAPRTPLESRMTKIWSQCLEISSVGVYDNFFEMGGDSLQAVDLMLRLSEELGREIPLALLIHHPSIAQMAEAIESGHNGKANQEPWFRLWRTSLLALRTTGNRAPVIFVPGGYTCENELLVCAGLLPHLAEEHPVFGVRLNLHAPRVLRPGSLHRLAGRIVRHALKQNFSCPPVIIGECLACPLALEVAQALAQKIKTPPRLLLLDSWHPRFPSRNDGIHPPAIARYYKLSREYEPKTYQGDVHIICAEKSQRAQACHDWWSPRLGMKCIAHEVPGDHHSYIRQHRKHLAQLLNSILE